MQRVFIVTAAAAAAHDMVTLEQPLVFPTVALKQTAGMNKI